MFDFANRWWVIAFSPTIIVLDYVYYVLFMSDHRLILRIEIQSQLQTKSVTPNKLQIRYYIQVKSLSSPFMELKKSMFTLGVNRSLLTSIHAH